MGDFEERLAYLHLGEEDITRLERLAPVLEKHADSFVVAFYRNLLSFGPTRELLSDPEVKERLISKQRAYLLSLGAPRFDDAYVRDRRRIGEAHHRIGLEPRWYLGAYALYFSLLMPIIRDSFSQDPAEASEIVVSLQKVLTLDAQLAMESYISASEERLEYLADELSRHSRQLARDYNDQSAVLRRTEEQARAAEQLASIATLVTGLAHEIGTPMGVIQGHAKMLEASVSGEDATWRLTTIQSQIGRISRIIQMLLNMARPRRSLRQPVALEPLIDTTLSFLSEKLGRRDIRVERRFEPTPSIRGDAERLQQLLLNLFLNAADAMPEGGELRIELREKEEGAEIRVVDDGAGIPEKDLPQIFDPFFTTKPAGEGNGLGLMVCEGIVHDHGGTIEVKSKHGQGTEFRILLPIAQPGRGGTGTPDPSSAAA